MAPRSIRNSGGCVFVYHLGYLPIFLLFFLLISVLHRLQKYCQAGYQGILAAVLQLLLYVKAAKAIGANNMAVTMAFVPVFSAMLAVPVLGEDFSIFIAIALLCVFSGAIFGNVHGNKDKNP